MKYNILKSKFTFRFCYKKLPNGQLIVYEKYPTFSLTKSFILSKNKVYTNSGIMFRWNKFVIHVEINIFDKYINKM